MVAETQYSVVGVMENLNESLAVMEAYIPGKIIYVIGLIVIIF